ncbi:MAG: hypothetical protein JWQ34_1218 [Mucilaginibacter sp.]|uniref:hypothetical protein n=1 Tax=Mucilaginibacter sp. TaxID=1882438 RepID=UPI0026088397|nr:hypothetical protein [Mucilaginibacter sp.]MDB5002993.1 hypothetical protein [Mucilaginibacter sp.]
MKTKKTFFYHKLVVPVCVLLLFSVSTVAQRAPMQNDDIAEKLKLNRWKNESPTLFIHFDKNIYSNNEQVWFTGYLFKVYNHQVYKTLSIALVNDDTHAILLNDKFVISNGIILGSTTVPDSVSAGNYSFIAYTNRLLNSKPNVLFTQRITIKSASEPLFTASLNPLDTSATADQQKVMLLVNFLNTTKPPETVPITYYVGNGIHPVLQGNVKTEFGKYIFNIPSSLLSVGNNKLHVRLSYKKEVKDINIALPIPAQPAIIKFYPEGGSLVNNISSNIGWEVTTATGSALKVRAILFEDRKAIANITTSEYGINRFLLKPIKGHSYHVKLVGINKKDTLYDLPPAITKGPIITIANAIVNDTLIAMVKATKAEKMYLIGHDYKQVFFASPVNIDTVSRRVKLIMNDAPKGLLQLTIVDSLGRPFAERLVFAHYNKREKLNINTDRATYNPRQKVTVKIKLDGTKQLDSALVSFACIQQNRIDITKKKDIESFVYLEDKLLNMPAKDNYLGNTTFDKQFLEDILLVKGWRRYTWLDMLNVLPTDTVKVEDIYFKGTVVTNSNKPIKKAVPLISFGNNYRPMDTKDNGDFELKYIDMVTGPDRMISYVVKGAKENEYKINLTDPYIALNKKVANDVEINDINFVEQYDTQKLRIPGSEHAIHIKEVQIKARADRKIYANACGDYICRYNIFNCPNHPYEPDNVLPVVGRSYIRWGVSTVYLGCGATDNKLSLKGIYLPKKFYIENIPEKTTEEPIYLSTLYWHHLVKVKSGQDTELSFYTGDIIGKFKIIVQGVTSDDVTYGEKTFDVVKPQ